MLKKELVELVAAQTGYSESHVAKVLNGSRENADIELAAAKIEKGVKNTTKVVKNTPAVKTVKTEDKVEVVPNATPDEFKQFMGDKGVKRMNPSEVGGILKQVREARNISKNDLAHRLELDRDEIDEIEADAAECTLDTFFAWFVACSVIIDIKLTFA